MLPSLVDAGSDDRLGIERSRGLRQDASVLSCNVLPSGRRSWLLSIYGSRSNEREELGCGAMSQSAGLPGSTRRRIPRPNRVELGVYSVFLLSWPDMSIYHGAWGMPNTLGYLHLDSKQAPTGSRFPRTRIYLSSTCGNVRWMLV